MIARLARNSSILAALAGVAALTQACGGGGGGDSPDAPSFGGVTVAMESPSDPSQGLPPGIEYTAPVKVGSQTFTEVMDTGSSILGVAASSCTGCGPTTLYSPGSTATDEHSTVESDYASGGWNGELFDDTVAIGSGPGESVKFGAIESSNMFFQGNLFDGIMGLALDGALDDGATQYLDTALDGTKLKNEFGVELCTTNGSLWLGGFDASHAKSAPAFSPMNAQLPVYAVTISGGTVGSTTFAASEFGPTIMDTGTSLAYVPTATYNKFTSALQGASGWSTVFGSQSATSQDALTTTMTAAQIDAALPPFTFTVPGTSTALSLPATQSYLVFAGAAGSGETAYFVGIQDGSQVVGNDLSLWGDTIMHGLVTVFDRANHQVGFAEQTGCAAVDSDEARRVVTYRPGQRPHWRVPSASKVRGFRR